ncbi:hypothetical protein VNO80_15356 [Phaseolus coccineus]|uniref:Uncharacterized protein n=1 Tax=Phaseolus coccineus TaxID=3886 RepID=A0AAN9QZ81_PHACN
MKEKKYLRNDIDLPYTKQVLELPQWKEKLWHGRVRNFCCLRGESEDGTLNALKKACLGSEDLSKRQLQVC